MAEELITQVFIRVSEQLGMDEETIGKLVAGVLCITPDEVKIAIEKTRRNG